MTTILRNVALACHELMSRVLKNSHYYESEVVSQVRKFESFAAEIGFSVWRTFLGGRLALREE